MKKKFLLSLLSIMFLLLNFNVLSAQAAKVQGGFIKQNTYTQGGRVNIDCEHLFMNPTAARTYATKSEQSVGEALAWFGGSFIPVAGPFISTAGLYSTLEKSAFVSNIRKYADAGQGVKVIISRDKFLGGMTRTATSWNQQDSSITGTCGNAPQYTKLIKKVVKY